MLAPRSAEKNCSENRVDQVYQCVLRVYCTKRMRPLNSCSSEFFVLSPTTFYRMYYHPDRIVHRWQSLCHRLRSTCEYLSLETLLLEDGFYVFLPSFDLLLPCVQRPLTQISNRPEVEKKSNSYCAIYKLCKSSTAEK